MSQLDDDPIPTGELVLQTLALPRDTNSNGAIFGGWIMSQMDLAGAIASREIAKGKVTTVAVGNMVFLIPVPVGSTVSCYCEILEVGRASVKTRIEVWIKTPASPDRAKVTDGEFVYVAIDDTGRTRPISR